MKTGRYIIRRQDRHAAVTFIEQQLNQQSQWIEGSEKQQLIAKQEYLDSRVNTNGINSWCAKWLNDEQWMQLRQAISAAQDFQDKRRQIPPLKTISLDHQAWQILANLAQQKNTTLSDVIISYLGNAHFGASTPVETDYNHTSSLT